MQLKPLPLLPFTCTIALLTATVVSSALTARRVPEMLSLPLEEVGNEIVGWQASHDNDLPKGTLHALSATEVLSRTYRRGSTELEVFVAYYAQQRAGESMHSPKHCLPGAGWEIWKHDSATVSIDGRELSVNKYSIQNHGTRMLMFYWYQSKDRVFASEYVGKLMLARDTLLTGRTGGSIVRVLLPDAPGSAEQGVAFVSELIPRVHRCFTGTAH